MTAEHDAPPTQTLVLDGSRVHDIASFYDEVNRVFMADEDWKLGASLDALDDLFHGAYGALKDAAFTRLLWLHIDRSREALGMDATRAWYQHRLQHPETFNTHVAQQKLDALERDRGPTYFDIVMQIIAEHPARLLLIHNDGERGWT